MIFLDNKQTQITSYFFSKSLNFSITKSIFFKVKTNTPYILNYLLVPLLSIVLFIFSILFIKDKFVKRLKISLFHTKLITFFDTCEMPKTSYNLGLKEYLFKIF